MLGGHSFPSQKTLFLLLKCLLSEQLVALVVCVFMGIWLGVVDGEDS